MDQWENEMKLYYKYFDTYEASYHLLLCLTQSRTSNLHSRIVSVLTEKAGIQNYTIQSQNGNMMVLSQNEAHSHLYEGLIK